MICSSPSLMLDIMLLPQYFDSTLSQYVIFSFKFAF